jgi:hypothetical protein
MVCGRSVETVFRLEDNKVERDYDGGDDDYATDEYGPPDDLAFGYSTG